ncbi:MAG: hypothetical protein ACE5JR_11735 [Gemmatimonadota bacterium]
MRGNVGVAAVAGLVLLPAAASGQAAPRSLADVGGDLVRFEVLEEERVVEVVVGPVHLAADMEHLRLPVQMTTFPVDGWLHGFEWVMRDGSGNELPRSLLHHVNLIDPDNRELFNPTARRVMAAGNETGAQRMPRLLGYPIEAGQRLLVSSMFSNTTGREIEDAYLHVRLFYSEEGDGLIQPRDVYPFYVDVMGPVGEKDFPVPPGRTVHYWEGSPAIDGRLLAIGAHLHEYADHIRLEDVTTGRVIWRAEPERDAAGRVVGVPSSKLFWRLGVKLYKDHVYRAVVEYYNPTDAPAPSRGMGAIGGIVWASKDAEWPEFSRSDEVYVADLRNTLEAPFRAAAHEHGHQSSEETAPREEAGEHEAGHRDQTHGTAKAGGSRVSVGTRTR